MKNKIPFYSLSLSVFYSKAIDLFFFIGSKLLSGLLRNIWHAYFRFIVSVSIFGCFFYKIPKSRPQWHIWISGAAAATLRVLTERYTRCWAACGRNFDLLFNFSAPSFEKWLLYYDPSKPQISVI